MPELPEVETVVRALRPRLVGKRIIRLRCDWPRHLALPGADEFAERVAGREILAVERRGKYLHFCLDGGEHLLIHLRMSGHLAVVGRDEEPDKHVHTVFELRGGEELRFRDTRKFGRAWLVRDPGEVLGDLGPEPLEGGFTAAALAKLLAGRRRMIKPMIMDQKVIAGIGNIYADEALFHARVHPGRTGGSLTEAEIALLHEGIQAVLREGIAREGATISTYAQPDGRKGDMQNAVKVFRRHGKKCYDCSSIVERITLAQRSTHFCPNCQK